MPGKRNRVPTTPPPMKKPRSESQCPTREMGPCSESQCPTREMGPCSESQCPTREMGPCSVPRRYSFRSRKRIREEESNDLTARKLF